ncbi:MAG: hypothetical protein IPI39_11865 [Candidatus Obscuribacter sp.]|nr:hypothetical protein [Candidatus Obscuribacter sp.]
MPVEVELTRKMVHGPGGSVESTIQGWSLSFAQSSLVKSTPSYVPASLG